jgi:Zn-dependent peptidase ImmA (M78 family)/transcriptional regulator with XRE-family HTH domain
VEIERKPVNSKTIEVARIARGYSQAELSEKMGIEQGTLSKLEKGLLRPKLEYMTKLCEALDYPMSFFEEEINILSPLVTHYRKRKALTKTKIDCIEYNLYIRKHFIKKLLASANIPYNLIQVSPEEHEPETIARIVRQKWNVPRGPVSSMVSLLERNGIIVLEIDINDEKLDGEMIPDENNLPVIYINKNVSGDRQRFTLAHELGHLVMHQSSYIPTVDGAESEANAFASEFLMPSDEIRYQLSENLTFWALADLKRHWKVSMASLVRKAYNLGAIDKSRYTSLNVQLSSAGFKKKEPEMDVVYENPTIIDQLLKLHIQHFNYTVEELSSMLCVNKVELLNMLSFYSKSPKGLRAV